MADNAEWKQAGDLLGAILGDKLGTARSHARLWNSWRDMTLAAFLGPSWKRIYNEENYALMSDDEHTARKTAFGNADRAASHSRIRDLRGTTLYVEADHAAWIQLLVTKRKHLLAILRREYRDFAIDDIVFTLRNESLEEASPYTSAETTPALPTENRSDVHSNNETDDDNSIVSIISNVKNPRLRAVLERMNPLRDASCAEDGGSDADEG